MSVLVSIIIDNYNYGQYIMEAIDSALNQTYGHVEVIVVDDGSTDNSREIIMGYGEKIIPVFKKNGGQASAFNAGYKKCKGDVIFFLDSDDALFPDAVKNVLTVFKKDKNISKVHWPLWVVDEQGRKSGAMRPSTTLPEGNFRDVVLAGGPTSCASSPTSGNAWARHFLEKVFPMPEQVNYYKTCADEYLYTLAPVFGAIKTIAEPQGFYRIHGKNIYSALSFDQKLKLELNGHGEQTTALSNVLRKFGFSVDEEKWKRNSWFHRLDQAKKKIEACISPAASFILIDDTTWDAKDMFPDYKVKPFIEQNGKYWGSPESDELALEVLQELCEEGMPFLVFTWSSFWWFQKYPKLHNYLRLHFNCIVENEQLIIFDLTEDVFENNPLVSIIINNYNYGRFLNEAINSALNQTYENIEVIVVDDGSTDNSKEIIESYGSKVIPVFKENGGQGSAYNEGFLKSNGQLICHLDADDTLLPNAIERVVPRFKNHDIIKVQWPLWIVDKKGKNTNEITTKGTPPEGDLKNMVLQSGPFYDFNFHTNSVVRRSLLVNILPMPEPQYKNGGDVYVTTLAPIFGQLQNCMEPLGTYRVHGNNNYAGNILDENRLKNYIERFETNCNSLEFYAKKLGYKVDGELWMDNFNYLWPTRLLAAKKDIEVIVQEGEKYILINGNEWSEGEPVANRFAIPLLEQDGKYAGFPGDDETAIRELDRLRNNGACFIVFWYTSFWWLDYYKSFYQYVCTEHTCVLKNERLVAFKLSSK